MTVEVVLDPELLDAFKADSSGLQHCVDEPDILSEGFGVSHNRMIFHAKIKNWLFHVVKQWRGYFCEWKEGKVLFCRFF